MRALFIGGTGTISMAISRLLVEQGWELYLLNRGSRKNVLDYCRYQQGTGSGGEDSRNGF